MSLWLPTVEDVLLLHRKLIGRTGGAEGVRDLGLIESALARAEASFIRFLFSHSPHFSARAHAILKH